MGQKRVKENRVRSCQNRYQSVSRRFISLLARGTKEGNKLALTGVIMISTKCAAGEDFAKCVVSKSSCEGEKLNVRVCLGARARIKVKGQQGTAHTTQ